MIRNTGGTTLYTQHYIDGIEYKDAGIEAIYHDEGRFYNASGTYRREYYIRDHLGNVRIAFSDLNNNGVIATPGEILQETHYDPFGWRLEGAYMNNSAPDNMYQYNGKENNTDHGLNLLDYGARWYNPVVGRFGSVDPLAPDRGWITPYNYVQNNPLIRVDPNGALDDYYFTRGGQYLGTDNVGNQIRIVDQFSEKDVKNTLDNIHVQSSESIRNLKASNPAVDELNASLSDNAQSNITTHFYEELGYSKSELKDGGFGVTNNGDIASTGFENGKLKILLAPGSIGTIMRNADDVKNMLVHERGGHGADFLEGKQYDYPSSYWSWEKSATSLQVNHQSWSGTSRVFRNNIYSAYGNKGYIFSINEQAKFFPWQAANKNLLK